MLPRFFRVSSAKFVYDYQADRVVARQSHGYCYTV